MKLEKIQLNEARSVSLTAYIQETGGEFSNIQRRPALLILPGGGYQFCSRREADPVAMPYLAAGYQVFILDYSVKEDAVWPNPLNDYEEAMSLIRKNKDVWHLYADKVAVIGFSAGGHLAACAATMSRNRPNAAILGYALMGEDVKGCNPTAPNAIAAVDRKTSPCFLFSSRTDGVVPVKNSILFMEALMESDVAFESHVYAYGPHGFSTGNSAVDLNAACSRTKNWVSDSIAWLTDLFGDFCREGGMTPPACPPSINGNGRDFLSMDCTFGYVWQNPEGKAVLRDFLTQAQVETPAEMEIDLSNPPLLFHSLKINDLMELGKIPPAQSAALAERLEGIRNL